MQVELITRADLEAAKNEILSALAMLGKQHMQVDKEWLRAKEARKLLGNISTGTLQNLRIKGLLHPSKVGGAFYYNRAEIQALLNGSKE